MECWGRSNAALQTGERRGYKNIPLALLALKDKLLGVVTPVLQCQLAEGFGGELYDEESAMIQKLSPREPLLCMNSAQVIHFNRMQTTLSCTR